MRTCIADVADPRRMRELFLRERPEVVFHAAAYKHVPLVEANPDQGFVTNVLGTLAVCEAAVAAGAERVVVISTDKAVNPSSFMGLTKRVAELMVVAVGQTGRVGHRPVGGALRQRAGQPRQRRADAAAPDRGRRTDHDHRTPTRSASS